MRGGFLHNEILVRPIERFFLSVGGLVCREYPAGNGFVDLFIQWESYRIVTEAELQWRRIGNDVVKATALHADLLLIVTPTWQTARLVRRKITLASNGPVICVLPPGAALQRLAICCHLRTGTNVGPSFNLTNHSNSKPRNSNGKAN